VQVHQAGSDDGRPGPRAEKEALRVRLLGARAERPEADRAAAGRLIRDHVLSRPEAEMAGTVAAYFSVGAEPGTRGLVYALWKRGTYVILPLLRPDGDLDWASYEGPDSLRPGPRGLLEPAEPARGVEAIARAGLVLAPALAVDVHGNRLGRGGGSFDRALARVGPRVPVIALLHDGELLERVPAEPHDRPVRLAVLPSRGIVNLQTPLYGALSLALGLREC
jgi:5-formyltetrahydrofolate cyclo-ligase